MPTVLSHPVVPLAIGLGLGRARVPTPLLLMGVVVSVLPDVDVLAFSWGVPYAAGLGHRGFTHSLLFALLIALLGAGMLRVSRISFWTATCFLFVSAASHGMLDAFTTGGLGIAFLWPWSEARWFAPIQVIKVAPLSLGRFLGPRGWAVLGSEFLWLWLPALGFVGVCLAWRRCMRTRLLRGY